MSRQNDERYDDIARTLASVALYLKSYSIIDRLANALSPDAVARGIYEMSRNLDAMAKSEFIKQVTEEEKPWIIISVERTTYSIYGTLASPARVAKFLDEATKNIRVVRSVASYAMYLAANAVINRTSSSDENDGDNENK